MFDKLVSFFSTKAVEDVGGVIDSLSTSDEEKSAAKAQLSQIVLTALNEATKAQADVLKVELQGNWLQRSWRPLLALSFGFIIICMYFFFPIVNLWVESQDLQDLITELKDNDGFWNLMELMIGGYVFARTVDKVSEKVTNNIDLPFIKKKNRAND